MFDQRSAQVLETRERKHIGGQPVCVDLHVDG